MLGESIAYIVDRRLTNAWDGARIRHVAKTWRLNKLNGRLLHVVYERVATRINVHAIEVID